jgi:hypothetical protein
MFATGNNAGADRLVSWQALSVWTSKTLRPCTKDGRRLAVMLKAPRSAKQSSSDGDDHPQVSMGSLRGRRRPEGDLSPYGAGSIALSLDPV